jgi:predicted  nucleic acid-binding Zn-ribbon protein
MGLFRRKAASTPASPAATITAAPDTTTPENLATDTTAIDDLRSELATLRARLDASDQAKADLEATVDALNQRLIVTAPPPPPPAVAEPIESVSAEQLAATDAVIERLQEHIGALDQRIELLDTRVTSVSTELANQLNEIGNDIEPMHESAERLANEQARYQIQFRQDLAELAERFRRPGTT